MQHRRRRESTQQTDTSLIHRPIESLEGDAQDRTAACAGAGLEPPLRSQVTTCCTVLFRPTSLALSRANGLLTGQGNTAQHRPRRNRCIRRAYTRGPPPTSEVLARPARNGRLDGVSLATSRRCRDRLGPGLVIDVVRIDVRLDPKRSSCSSTAAGGSHGRNMVVSPCRSRWHRSDVVEARQLHDSPRVSSRRRRRADWLALHGGIVRVAARS